MRFAPVNRHFSTRLIDCKRIMSTQSGTSSKYKTVAAVFDERGFVWPSSVKADDVLSNSNDISFEDDWNQFATLVANNTHDDETNKPHNTASS